MIRKYQGRCPIPGCRKVFKDKHIGIDGHINSKDHDADFNGEAYEERYRLFKLRYPKPWPIYEPERR